MLGLLKATPPAFPALAASILLFAGCVTSLSTTGEGGAGGSGGTGTGASGTGASGTGATGGGGSGGGATAPLGMNDVTVLVPLSPTSVQLKATDVADDGAPLVPNAVFEQLIKDPMGQDQIFETLDRFQITAVRFDVCDRVNPGPCPAGSDGRLRVVFQPVDATLGAADAGLHAFYSIPAAEMPAVVAQLRQLAELQAEPTTSPLKVSPALSKDPEGAYASQLRSLIIARSGEKRLTRLTFLAQPEVNQAVLWVARGVEDQGSGLVPIQIPDINATSETTILTGTNSYDVTPLVDAPAGIALAWQEKDFGASSANAKAQALAALAGVESPLASTPGTVQCMTCHTSTLLTAVRSKAAGVDPLTVPGRYTSSYDLSIAAGESAQSPFFVRGLGWRGETPLISQRAANETAQALTEIEARFPPP